MNEDWASQGARLTADAVKTTMKYLPAQHYDIRLIPNDEVIGSPIPRCYSREVLLKSIGYLRMMNRSGHHVYFRPNTPQFIFLDIDDASSTGLEAMKADGIRPVLVYETSPGLQHAWVQLANRPEQLTDLEATTASKIIANRYGGDRGSTGAKQLGRLPGYRNLKSKYEDKNGGHPLVIIKQNVFAPVAHELLSKARELIADSPSLPPSPVGQVIPNQSWDGVTISSDLAAEVGREVYEATVADLADRYGWRLPIVEGDRSDTDIAVARSLLWRGKCKPEDIAAVLMFGSDKAQERGIKYVSSIVIAALAD